MGGRTKAAWGAIAALLLVGLGWLAPGERPDAGAGALPGRPEAERQVVAQRTPARPALAEPGDQRVAVAPEGSGDDAAPEAGSAPLPTRLRISGLRARALTGRVVDAADRPLSGWTVAARSGAVSTWTTSAVTDAEGRFRLDVRADCQLLLELTQLQERDPVPLLRRAVHADEDELVLRVGPKALPHGSITAQILDADGAPARGALVLSTDGGASRRPFPLDEEGRFLLERLPAGVYQLAVEVTRGADLALDPVLVRPAERVDLGLLRLEPPGFLQLVVDETTPPERGGWEYLDLRRELADPSGVRLAGPATRHHATTRRFSLRPGRYELRLGGGGVGAELRRFEIRAGEETRVEVAPRPGRHCSIGVSIPEDAPVPYQVALRLFDDGGRVVLDMPVGGSASRRLMAGTALAAGRYTLEAHTLDGRSARGEFVVEAPPHDPGARPPELVLPLE